MTSRRMGKMKQRQLNKKNNISLLKIGNRIVVDLEKHIRKVFSRTVRICLAVFFIVGVCFPMTTEAQDTVDLRPWNQKKLDCRITLEAGVGNMFGVGYAFTGVASEVRYHFNERFTLSAGVKVTEGFGLGRNYGFDGRGGKSLAPRKGGSRLYEMYVSGEYQVNERLWVAATLLHIGGTIDFVPWYGDGSHNVSATAFSADLRYRTRRGNMLGFHLSYINDKGGLMAPYLYSPYLYDPCWDDPFWYGETLRGVFGRSFGFYY